MDIVSVVQVACNLCKREKYKKICRSESCCACSGEGAGTSTRSSPQDATCCALLWFVLNVLYLYKRCRTMPPA